MVNKIIIVMLIATASILAGLPEREYIELELKKNSHVQNLHTKDYLTLYGDATFGNSRDIKYNGYWSGMLAVDLNITNWIHEGNLEGLSPDLKRIRLEYTLDSLKEDEVFRKSSIISSLTFVNDNPIKMPYFCSTSVLMSDNISYYDAAIICHRMELMQLGYNKKIKMMQDTLKMLFDVSNVTPFKHKPLIDRLDTYIDTSTIMNGPPIFNIGIRAGKIFGLNGPINEDLFTSIYISVPLSRLWKTSPYRQHNNIMRYEVRQSKLMIDSNDSKRITQKELDIHIKSLDYINKQIATQSNLIKSIKFRLDNGLENEPSKLFRAHLDYMIIVQKQHAIKFRLNYLNTLIKGKYGPKL